MTPICVRVLLLLLALPALAAAQVADVLTGRVVGEDGQPAVGAQVTATSLETEITRAALTDDRGRYMIHFPDGGGRYVLRVALLGMADAVQSVVREGQEELLVANVTLSTEPIALEGLEVTAQRAPSALGPTGEQSTGLSQEILNRLPLADMDAATLALMAAGVVATQLDSLSGRAGFSVGGMSDQLNQILLDGTILSEGALSIPQEGIRRTQITTSTFDASRGGFAGGQVTMTSARGTNRAAGSLLYQMDDRALQFSSLPTAYGQTRHNLGGSFGGPLVGNRLFYNVAFGAWRSVAHRFALAADDPLASTRSGVATDSIARFLSLLSTHLGEQPVPRGPYGQLSDNLSLQLRTDWNVVQRQSQAHTLTVRLNASLAEHDSTGISTLDLPQHGGEADGDDASASVSLSSRLGGSWTNELGVSYTSGNSSSSPYAEIPEGRVRVTSELDDGQRGTEALTFGGNRGMPTGGRYRTFQIGDDLSFLLPLGDQLHRLKLGGTLQRAESTGRGAQNVAGAFTYGSLEAFALNRPLRYERTLAPQEASTASVMAGLYVGDTWRIADPLEVTLGLRWDHARVEQVPDHNPEIERAFGRRTDIDPSAAAFSPRLGFNLRTSSAGARGGGSSISGGVGLFAGNLPTDIFAAAARQTGLPSSEQELVCIGAATPVPDWDLYRADPSAVPMACAEAPPGPSDVLASRAPTVTLIDPRQELPSSLRADIGYRARLPFGLDTSLRYTYSRGLALWGYYDLNLDEDRSFLLPRENRPFYGDPTAIVPGTGATSIAGSRLHEEFGGVYDVRADRESSTHQVSALLNGRLPLGFLVSTNYTLGFARDQASGPFSTAATAGNPNQPEWGWSDNDRRHTLNVSLARTVSPEFELAATARLSSGAPFTPMVATDVNGDGTPNDRAFIFDPAAPDSLGQGMARLFGVLPEGVAGCLRAQVGRIAERNSCRGPWSRSLSLRASLRPSLPGLDRRLTLSIDASHVLTGLDELIHGADDLRGWGTVSRPETRLLEVEGFDPDARAFRYQVNEAFGQARRGRNAAQNAFALRLTARIAIGGSPQQSNRGFGPPGRFAAEEVRRAAPAAPEMDFGLRAATMDRDSLVERAFPNPLSALLAEGDALALTPAQRERLAALSDSLDARLAAPRDGFRRALGALDVAEIAAEARSGGDPQALLRRVAPDVVAAVEEGQRLAADALAAAQGVLTPEQWARMPAGALEPERAQDGAGPLLERLLRNPLPAMLAMGEALGLDERQRADLQALADRLEVDLAERRTTWAARLDAVPPAARMEAMQDLQPEVQDVRERVRDALEEAARILTPEQWARVPQELRLPPMIQGGPRR